MLKCDDAKDWTLQLPDTDHVRYFREKDWSTSALGPPELWEPTLQLFVKQLFADSRAACIWW